MPVIRRWPVWSALLFALAVGLGIVVTHTTLTTPTELRLDERLHDAHAGWATTVMTGITDAASPVAGLAIIVIWSLVLLATRRPLLAVQTFTVVAVGWNISLVLKNIIGRDRPPLATESHNSFPSGHVSFATAAVIAAYFLARGTRWARPIAIVGPVAIAAVMFSRIYLGAHYLTDTVGSVLVTSAAAIAVTGLWPKVITGFTAKGSRGGGGGAPATSPEGRRPSVSSSR